MRLLLLAALLIVSAASAMPASAQPLPGERLCDTAFENCRTPLINLIKAETKGIDVAFWFMEDTRFSAEIINRWRAGVPVRVLVDTKANPSYPGNVTVLNRLKAAKIPIRNICCADPFLHWKMMIFVDQKIVQFSGANYSNYAFAPVTAYSNYVDEIIYFTPKIEFVQSFMRKYDDAWMSSTFSDYANVTRPLVRQIPELEGYPIHPDLNFPPGGNGYAARSFQGYRAETEGIDSIIYRITQNSHATELINAKLGDRRVPVRILSEPKQYRDPKRSLHSYNIDRMYMAGIEIRMRRHEGLNHEKLTLLASQRMAVFGSSNWTVSSDDYQLEHNLFTREPWMYDWARAHFERKWNSTSEFKPFVPLKPDVPVLKVPANGAVDQPLSMRFEWYAGPWAHKYDLLLGTSPTTMTPVFADIEMGASCPPPTALCTDKILPATVKYTHNGLQPGTKYYWKIISRTMADIPRTGQTFSFTTAGDALPPPPTPPLGAGDVVLYASKAPITQDWAVVSDATAAGGSRLSNPNRAAAKVSAPQVTPTRYFEMSFKADAGVPYHLWVRGNATNNSYNNDSVYVQFDNSVSSTGVPVDRIDSTSGLAVTIETCNGCGLANWGWNDNSYEGLGRHVYFGTSGTETIRVQVREDGLSIDQIVLSRGSYLTSSPGAAKDDATRLAEADGTPP